MCWHVTRQMVQTVTQTAHKLVGKTKKQPMELMTQSETDRLLPSAVCLVESLERLLASPVTDTLRYFIKLGVQEASTTMALLSNDSQLSLCVNRILVILSFYEMTELFDGIKVVNHDPIALSGFLKIIERELKKGFVWFSSGFSKSKLWGFQVIWRRYLSCFTSLKSTGRACPAKCLSTLSKAKPLTLRTN